MLENNIRVGTFIPVDFSYSLSPTIGYDPITIEMGPVCICCYKKERKERKSGRSGVEFLYLSWFPMVFSMVQLGVQCPLEWGKLGRSSSRQQPPEPWNSGSTTMYYIASNSMTRLLEHSLAQPTESRILSNNIIHTT